MPPRISRLLSSRLLEVTSSDKSFFIHGGILAAQSDLLRRAIMGGAEKIDLSRWDSNTMELFVEFLYTGDYDPRQALEMDESGGEGEAEEEGDVVVGRRDGAYTPDTVQSLADQTDLGTRDTNMLLAHAKIYTLAEHNGIGALQTMAVERLKLEFEKTPEVMTDVIELLGYVYSNTTTRGPMRDLVSKFAAENIVSLVALEEMRILLKNGDDLAVELMDMVAHKLCLAEHRICSLEGSVQDRENQRTPQPETGSVSLEVAQKLEATHVGRVLGLEAANAGAVLKLEAANAEIKRLEEKIQGLEIVNEAEVKQLVKKIQEAQTGSTYETLGLEGDAQWLLSNLRRFGDTYPVLMRAFQNRDEETTQMLKRKVEWFENSCPEKAQEFLSSDLVLLWKFDSLRQLKGKAEWFEKACPEEAQRWEREHKDSC